MSQCVDDLPGRKQSVDRARTANMATAGSWNVANRTKVVRLFVPANLDITNVAQVRAYAQSRHATRQDVFCIKGPNGWEPMSWLGDGLVDHRDAAKQHPEVVVVLMGVDREQIQFECDVDFWISKIEKHPKPNLEFPTDGNPPTGHPFRSNLINELGAQGKPVRTGPMEGPRALRGFNQLYKFTFMLTVPGEPKPVQIDPDMYCDWN